MEPADATEREYAETLTRHILSGDRDAYRALHQWGERRYDRHHPDLVAWAEDRAATQRRMDDLDTRLADLFAHLQDNPVVEEVAPETKPEPAVEVEFVPAKPLVEAVQDTPTAKTQRKPVSTSPTGPTGATARPKPTGPTGKTGPTGSSRSAHPTGPTGPRPPAAAAQRSRR